jgi:hypothetical protein
MEEQKWTKPTHWHVLAKVIHERYLVRLWSANASRSLDSLRPILEKPACPESLGVFINYFLLARQILQLWQLLSGRDPATTLQDRLAGLAAEEQRLLKSYDEELKPALEALSKGQQGYLIRRTDAARQDFKTLADKLLPVAERVAGELCRNLHPFLGPNAFCHRTLQSLDALSQALKSTDAKMLRVFAEKVAAVAPWQYTPFFAAGMIWQRSTPKDKKEDKKESDPLSLVKLYYFDRAEIIAAFETIRKLALEYLTPELPKTDLPIDPEDLAKLATVCSSKIEELFVPLLPA